MSKKARHYTPGALVTVYGRWPGIVKGHGNSPSSYVVQYVKHGSNLVGFIEGSKLKPRCA